MLRRSPFVSPSVPERSQPDPTGSPRPASAAKLAGQRLEGLVSRVPGPLARWYRTADGRKKTRYALVSAVSVPIGTVAVGIFNLIGLSAAWAALAGNSVGAIPSYGLNRYWVWGKTDANRLLREILPFWIITVVGIAASFLVAREAGRLTRDHGITGPARLTILLTANLAGFGVLWVVKYVIFDRLLFVARGRTRAADLTPPLPSSEAQAS